jgi:hypothetical protein
MEKSKTAKPKSTKKLIITKKHVIIISVSVVFAAMVVTIICLLTRPNAVASGSNDDRATVVTQGNADEVKAAMDEPVEDGYYNVVMNTEWTFDGETSDAYVENSQSNTRTVYFDVFRSDTKELVYSSPYIPVGEKIQGFVLDADLAPGSYDGLVTYHLVDDNHEEVSNLSVSVTFQVN